MIPTRIEEVNKLNVLLPKLLGPSPLDLAYGLLALGQTQLEVRGREHLPAGPALVVSNHRSFMDALVMMAALDRNVHVACHYYMTQVPGMRELVNQLGCLPLEQGARQQRDFFRRAEALLRQRQAVGIFPEGAGLITQSSQPQDMVHFRRGFAHLALRSQVDPLPIVPIAIRVRRELEAPAIPFSLFRWFDPAEPMFQAAGGHPVVIYQEVEAAIAPPIWVTQAMRQQAQTQGSAAAAQQLAQRVEALLQTLIQRESHA